MLRVARKFGQASKCRKAMAAGLAVLRARIDDLDLGPRENDAEARAAICAGASWAGVGLDAERKRSARDPLHDTGSQCAVLVCPRSSSTRLAMLVGWPIQMGEPMMTISAAVTLARRARHWSPEPFIGANVRRDAVRSHMDDLVVGVTH